MTTPAPAFDAQGLTDTIGSMAQATGLFDTVSSHEPASLPTSGMAAAVWLQSITPVKKVSGLDKTSARVEYRLRLYVPMITGNMDAIDPKMATATAILIGVLSADFTLGGEVFEVDLLGSCGAPLSSKADYYRQADQFYRITDITIPIVLDAVWTQGAGE